MDVNVFFIYAGCCTCVGTTSGISTGWGINGLKAAMLRSIMGCCWMRGFMGANSIVSCIKNSMTNQQVEEGDAVSLL